jgi:co-chaperonin GroES (HSP10)
MKKEKEFKFHEHFRPVANWVVTEDVKIIEAGSTTKGGIIIPKNLGKSSTPEADEGKRTGDSMGRRVVAVGPDVTRVKLGDLVFEAPGVQVAGLDFFGKRYYFIQDYSILATLSEEADEIHNRITEDIRKEKEEIAKAQRELYFKVPPTEPKLDIN